MLTSVALATHNGERFLPDQLASIRNQTRPPHEVVLCDDHSSDGTLEIASRFAQSAPFHVRIETSPVRLGSTRNFARAIALCTGEAIALADQDDVWMPHKLEFLAAELQRRPDAAFAFSDAEVVDANLNSLGYRLWDALGFRPAEQRRFAEGRAFEALLRRNRVTGATMVFRTELRDRLLPMPDGWVHDAWIALILSAIAPCTPLPHTLIRYRQHSGQLVGGKRRSFIDEWHAARRLDERTCESVADRFQEASERLHGMPGVSGERLRLIGEKVEHHRRRAAMRRTWRLPHALSEAVRGRYSRFGQGWKSLAQDLILS